MGSLFRERDPGTRRSESSPRGVGRPVGTAGGGTPAGPGRSNGRAAGKVDGLCCESHPSVTPTCRVVPGSPVFRPASRGSAKPARLTVLPVSVRAVAISNAGRLDHCRFAENGAGRGSTWGTAPFGTETTSGRECPSRSSSSCSQMMRPPRDSSSSPARWTECAARQDGVLGQFSVVSPRGLGQHFLQLDLKHPSGHSVEHMKAIHKADLRPRVFQEAIQAVLRPKFGTILHLVANTDGIIENLFEIYGGSVIQYETRRTRYTSLECHEPTRSRP